MTDPPIVKRKGFAYVTSRGPAGERLLIFSHPNAPEAGLQVPAGTLLDGESPEACALREAREETGLDDLEVVSFLGEQLRDARSVGKNELHHRYFFHLRCTAAAPPERWRILENYPSDQLEAGVAELERPLFELFWVDLPNGVSPLIAGHDHYLHLLLERLGLTPSPRRV